LPVGPLFNFYCLPKIVTRQRASWTAVQTEQRAKQDLEREQNAVISMLVGK